MDSRINQDTIIHQARIDVIYWSVNHEKSLREIARIVMAPFSTVRTVINEFKAFGRSNKLLDITMKAKLLEHRCQHMQAIG